MNKAKQKSILFLVLAFAVMYTCCVGLGIYCENAAVYDANFWTVGILIFSYLLSFYFVYRSKCIVACALAAIISIIVSLVYYLRFLTMVFFPWAGTAYWIGVYYKIEVLDLILAICTTICLIILIIMKEYKLGVWKVQGQDSGIKILSNQINSFGKLKSIILLVIVIICLVGAISGVVYLLKPINVDYKFICESTPIPNDEYYEFGNMYTCNNLEECGKYLEMYDETFIDDNAYRKIADTVDFDKYFIVATYEYEVESIVCNNYEKIYCDDYPKGKLIFKESQPQHKAYIYAVSKLDIQGLNETIIFYDEKKNSFKQEY